jgi:hypothetical protein
MRITAHGYSRNAGDSIILDQQLELGPKQKYPRRRPEVTNITRRPNDVRVVVGPVHLTFSGKYWLNLEFSDDDIARLLLRAHPQVRAAIEGIYVQREPSTETASP